jgi:hypothetical protein
MDTVNEGQQYGDESEWNSVQFTPTKDLSDPLALVVKQEAVSLAVGFHWSFYSVHRVYLCVPYGSHNKQRLFPPTALTGWAL